MEFIELAKKRYSARSYSSKPVENAMLLTILRAGWVAPTAGNAQPNKFLVLNDAKAFEKLAKTANAHGAPLCIVICADKSVAWVRTFDKASMVDIDASIAACHMMLQAEDLGLGSCWLTYFDPAVISREFDLPENIVPVNILAIGYPIGQAASPERHSEARKPLEEIIVYNKF